MQTLFSDGNFLIREQNPVLSLQFTQSLTFFGLYGSEFPIVPPGNESIGFQLSRFFSLHLDAADASSPATVPTLISSISIIADGIKTQNSSNAVTNKTHLRK